MLRRLPIPTEITAIFLLFGATVVLQVQPGRLSTKVKFLAPPPERLELFTFGFSESVADSLWLRWIQDGDACQTYSGVRVTLPAAGPVDEDFAGIRNRQCDFSWSFKMLDAATKVSPKFRMPYLAGILTLAVVVEDYEGATLLFERAIQNYPADWQILYKAGYHYLFDLHDFPRAAELFARAATNGAPDWLNLLVARLYSRAGQIEIGITTLETYLKTLDQPGPRKHVEERLEKLRRELAAAKPDGP